MTTSVGNNTINMAQRDELNSIPMIDSDINSLSSEQRDYLLRGIPAVYGIRIALYASTDGLDANIRYLDENGEVAHAFDPSILGPYRSPNLSDWVEGKVRRFPGVVNFAGYPAAARKEILDTKRRFADLQIHLEKIFAMFPLEIVHESNVGNSQARVEFRIPLAFASSRPDPNARRQ